MKKMKKTFRMIGMVCLLGAFAFAGSSCKKEKTEVTSFRVSLPAVEEASVDEDRAYIDYNDGNQMKWYRDDQIAFYNLAEDYTHSVRNVYDLTSGANTLDGYFTGDVMGELNEGFDGYYAFYPASKVVNHPIGPRNSQTFDVPNKQVLQPVPGQTTTFMDPTSLVMAVKGTEIMDHFNMNHIFGFAGLKLKGDRAVDKIVVEDIEFPLSGTVTLDLPYITYENAFVLDRRCEELSLYQADYDVVIGQIQGMCNDMHYSAHSTGNTMTLECGGVQLNPNDYTRFIVTLRPGALHKGFKVTVYYTEGEPDVINKFNPDVPAEYGYNNQERYPRRFCIRPGRTMNYTLN
jgi:hypothetical protein